MLILSLGYSVALGLCLNIKFYVRIAVLAYLAFHSLIQLIMLIMPIISEPFEICGVLQLINTLPTYGLGYFAPLCSISSSISILIVVAVQVG